MSWEPRPHQSVASPTQTSPYRPEGERLNDWGEILAAQPKDEKEAALHTQASCRPLCLLLCLTRLARSAVRVALCVVAVP